MYYVLCEMYYVDVRYEILESYNVLSIKYLKKDHKNVI